MQNEVKRKSLTQSLWATIPLLLIGAALLIGYAGKMRYVVFGFTDFTTLQVDEIHSGMLVDVTLVNNYGTFASRTVTDSDTKKTSVTDYYYVIYTGAYDDYESEFRYMAIRVDDSMSSEMDEMSEDTRNGEWSDELTFSGEIKTMSGEVEEYFYEFFEEMGYKESEIDELTLPYYIDASGGKFSLCSFYILMYIIGAALAGWGILRLVRASRGYYIKGFMEAVTATGISPEVVDADYRAAQTFAKMQGIRVGRLFTYYGLNSTKPKAILNGSISWAYQSVTQHRTNGIKSGKTYSVNVYTEKNGGWQMNDIPLSQKTAQELLQMYASRFPWIVIGYNEEISKLYGKDHEQFLNLKFYKVDRNSAV
ncbi:MAG: hypothetical protein LUE29_02435 [Lachnospiraceae bacterium]|nr:hypothetical protein [Lachnospiraceae bacterium]